MSLLKYGEEEEMPRKPRVPCKHPGCPELVEAGTRYCDKHKSLHPEEERSANGRGYGRAWQRARKRYLEAHPLCAECEREGRYTKATVVDHIKPHRGDSRLFWDTGNWQALCEHHHNVKTGNEDSHPTYHY